MCSYDFIKSKGEGLPLVYPSLRFQRFYFQFLYVLFVLLSADSFSVMSFGIILTVCLKRVVLRYCDISMLSPIFILFVNI